MAYVSNMTNGHCDYVFKQEVLTQQSAWETERPVKPVLERLFKGKAWSLLKLWIFFLHHDSIHAHVIMFLQKSH